MGCRKYLNIPEIPFITFSDRSAEIVVSVHFLREVPVSMILSTCFV